MKSTNIINVNNFSVGKDGAIAEVRTLWSGKYLYVLAEVVDDVLNSEDKSPSPCKQIFTFSFWLFNKAISLF